jgi:CubicO group peptidase (beta-lactamase class C family)
MLKKIIKLSITLMMVCIFIMTSEPFSVQVKGAVNYSSVKAWADLTADTLISGYGETSVSYALIDNDEIVVSGQSGVYSKTDNSELTKDDMYGIGSISKMFTTTAVMQLVDSGKVKLDNPITKYIPEFKMEDSRYKKITVRMLLNHSSGLMGSSYNNMMSFDNNAIDYEEFIKNLSTQRLKADPGAFSVYCNDGFTLAQMLVEKVSGISFTDYMKQYITNPLSITNTKTPDDDFSRDRLVKTYLYNSKKALPTEDISAIGAGGIYSTPEDLCRFSEAFMKESNLKLLTAETAIQTANAEYLNGLWYPDEDSSLSYGLGWDSVNTYPFTEYGIQALIKGGDTGVFHGSLIVLPGEDMAVAVLSSGGASIYNQVFAQELLLKALLAKGAIEKIHEDKTFENIIRGTMPSEMAEYSGYYGYMSGVVRIDISKDGVLSTYAGESASSMSSQKLYYTGDGRFYTTDGSAYVSFMKEDNGNTYLFASGYASLPALGQLASSEYQAQKLEPVKISDAVKAVWENRKDKKYFMINEIYSSEVYALESPIMIGTMRTKLDGYFDNACIIDKNNAEMQIQIPGINGRDLYNLEYYLKNKTEYLKMSDLLYISEDAISTLSTKANFQVTIGQEEYAKWFKVDKKSQGKKIKVTIPATASWSVYRSDGTCIYNSYTYDGTTVTLPTGGYLVFAGNKGVKFNIKYIK